MYEVRQTKQFAKWIRALKDHKAKAAIAERIFRLQNRNFGDVKRFEGIGELRIHIGPGYRVYFTQRDETIVILLCGGDKGSQKRDIKRAKEMAQEAQ